MYMFKLFHIAAEAGERILSGPVYSKLAVDSRASRHV
jgi:hypothetical protein